MVITEITLEEEAPVMTAKRPAQQKKDGVQQTVVERFRTSPEAQPPRAATRSKTRSPYWQPADQEC